jgi:hypothetical protein
MVAELPKRGEGDKASFIGFFSLPLGVSLKKEIFLCLKQVRKSRFLQPIGI